MAGNAASNSLHYRSGLRQTQSGGRGFELAPNLVLWLADRVRISAAFMANKAISTCDSAQSIINPKLFIVWPPERHEGKHRKRSIVDSSQTAPRGAEQPHRHNGDDEHDADLHCSAILVSTRGTTHIVRTSPKDDGHSSFMTVCNLSVPRQ
jgi:hypothetical protein